VETIVVDGLALAQEIRKELSEAVGRHVASGRRAPHLAVVRVGDDPASASYIKGKRRACDSIGMGSTETHLPESTTPVELDAALAELNGTQHVDGILVQLPLPRQLDAKAIARAIDPAKDVDGLHPINAGACSRAPPRSSRARRSGSWRSCAATRPLEGAEAVVIGRSDIVGKPVAVLLQQANATVTQCHSRTRDLREHCRRADVLVAAVGVPKLVQRDWVKPAPR
jgi:methylenetetrahydrofolate dehydrogenase (NADP+)/methenyltetrahydrofolate cyclohydrolase